MPMRKTQHLYSYRTCVCATHTPRFDYLFVKCVNISFLSVYDTHLHICIQKGEKKLKSLTANFLRSEEKTKQPRIKTAMALAR